MHPIERLRYVARIEGVDPALLAREAAEALAEAAEIEPAGTLPACRRLVERHPECGPVWWLSARVLAAGDPPSAARQAALELEDDRTARVLAAALPDEATLLVVGWPDHVTEALRRRSDLEVLVVDGGGEGSVLARRLADAGHEVSAVADAGVGTASAVADLVLLEALAAGPSGLLATPGSRAAAAAAAHAGVAVWAVAGVGRVLPALLWDAALSGLDDGGLEPWERAAELVPADLVSSVAGPEEVSSDVAAAFGTSTCEAPAALVVGRDRRAGR